MINVTLRQLRYFDAVARLGHFGRAAETCAVSQPALSMQIKELEEALGAPLFERGARQIGVTDFGELIALRTRDILRAVDELEGLARASRDRPLRRLRLGVIPTVAPYLLPTILQDLKSAFPDLEIDVRETLTPKLIEELSEGGLDAAIVALPISEPSFVELALFSEEFLLVRPSEDQGAPPPDREALCGMKLLLLEEGHCFRDQALAFCNMTSAQPRDALDASSLSTLVQLVGSGLGVTFVPEMAVAVETRAASVSLTRFDSPKPSRTVGMIWRKTTPLTRQLTDVAEVVRRAAETLRSAGAASPGR